MRISASQTCVAPTLEDANLTDAYLFGADFARHAVKGAQLNNTNVTAALLDGSAADQYSKSILRDSVRDESRNQAYIEIKERLSGNTIWYASIPIPNVLMAASGVALGLPNPEK